MDKTKAAKNQKLFGIAAVAFLSIGIVHVGYKALEISAHEEWGMPWYFAIFSPGLVYVFPLIVCIVAYFFFSKELKKKKGNAYAIGVIEKFGSDNLLFIVSKYPIEVICPALRYGL